MATKTKCFVEIFFIENDFISLDFGDFAIVIGYNGLKNVDELSVFFADDYLKKFMSCYCCPKIGSLPDSPDSIVINFDDFVEIKDAFSRRTRMSNSRLWNLLKKNFPKQIKLYGR